MTQNGKVVRETIGSGSSATVLDFIYDNQGRPFALNHSTGSNSEPTTYYYVLNLQGDVVRMIDSSGATVAIYSYDAWGNPISSSGTMASINPLRYRGYYYDPETGFYYLQSRYYDPVMHRFINADSFASTGAGFLGNNMFAYCNNNPVMMTDSAGCRPIWEHDFGNGVVGYTDTGTGTPQNSAQPEAFTGKDVVPRDVTDEVNNALIIETQVALYYKNKDFVTRALVFYTRVNHGCPWDIKLEDPWIDTIGTPYPGEGATIIYCGAKMTLEDLGNYTYGCIGRTYGFDLATLLWGSAYAAGFPEQGTDAWENEYIFDQFFIELGYNYGYFTMFS